MSRTSVTQEPVGTSRKPIDAAKEAVSTEQLAELRQFVGWKYGKPRKGGQCEKVPINPHTGRRADVADPATWGTLEQATRHANEEGLDGTGFVFTAEDEFAGIDLDNCRDPETSIIDPWAWKAIRRFSSYTEVSPSGTGVKIFVRGQLPEGRNRRSPVEMYDRGRFFTITGDVLDGYKTIESRQKALEGLHTRVCAGSPQKSNTGRREATPVSIGDQELLDKARTAGNGAKFRALYDHGDTSGYRSQSEADIDLMGILAFWTGRDEGRMESLFSASALGQRDKWTRREDYRKRTVNLAANRCKKTYTPKPTPKPTIREGAVHQLLDGVEAEVERYSWPRRSGPTDEHMVGGFIQRARDYGKVGEGGIIVAASWRDLALAAGVSDATAKASVKRLTTEGTWVKLIKKGKGRKANTYLILTKLAHKEQGAGASTKLAHKESPPPCVHGYGLVSSPSLKALLRKWRNPAPQVEAEYDKNGRKIAHDPSSLKRSRGKMHALFVERTVARPGITLSEMAAALDRAPAKIASIASALIADGFTVEEGGGYYAPHDLVDRLLDERRDTGSDQRERLQSDRHARERAMYEKRLQEQQRRRKERLAEVARECGVEPEADGYVEEQECAEYPKGDAVVTDANDPEQFKALAAILREGVEATRAQREPFQWPHDPKKAAFYNEVRAEDECRKAAGEMPWVKPLKEQRKST